MRQAKGVTNGRSRIEYIVGKNENVTLRGDVKRRDGEFWQGGSPVCWEICPAVGTGEVAADSGRDRY